MRGPGLQRAHPRGNLDAPAFDWKTDPALVLDMDAAQAAAEGLQEPAPTHALDLWPDASKTAHTTTVTPKGVATVTVSNPDFNGRPTVDLAANAVVYVAQQGFSLSAGAAGVSVYTVARSDYNAVLQYLYKNPRPQIYVRFYSYVNSLVFDNTGSNYSTWNGNPSAPAVVATRFEPGSLTMSIDGALRKDDASKTGVKVPLENSVSTIGHSFSGPVARLLQYNRRLSDDENKAVIAGLAAEYGITIGA